MDDELGERTRNHERVAQLDSSSPPKPCLDELGERTRGVGVSTEHGPRSGRRELSEQRVHRV